MKTARATYELVSPPQTDDTNREHDAMTARARYKRDADQKEEINVTERRASSVLSTS